MAAATEEPFDVINSPALPVLLQHSSIAGQQPVVLLLLAVNKLMRAAVLRSCRGQLEVQMDRLNEEEARSASRWLGRCGSLVAAITATATSSAALEALAAGLAQAAAGPLCLQAFSCRPISTPLLQVLAAHYSTTLKRLTFGDICDVPCTVTWAVVQSAPGAAATLAAAREAISALAQLTELVVGSTREAPALSDAVATLPQLRRLTTCTFPWHFVEAHPLPASIEHLELFDCSEMKASERLQAGKPGLSMGHLSALTSFNCCSLALVAGDQLPPQLVQLTALDASVQALQQLGSLRSLYLVWSTATAAELQQLSRQLTALTAVTLGYYHPDATAHAAAAGWSSLPVKALQIPLYNSMYKHFTDAQATLLLNLGCVTGLTSLNITGDGNRVLGPANKVAAALRQLTGLQVIRLAGPSVTAADAVEQEEDEHEEAGASAAATAIADDGGGGFAFLFRVFGELRHLRSLELSHVMSRATAAENAAVAAWLQSAAASQLAAATQLTCLRVWRCDWFTDDILEVVVRGLQGLRRLEVQYQQHISDAALPVIALSLRQLTLLDMSGTSVTDAGLRSLTALLQLQQVVRLEIPSGGCLVMQGHELLHQAVIPKNTEVSMMRVQLTAKGEPHVSCKGPDCCGLRPHCTVMPGDPAPAAGEDLAGSSDDSGVDTDSSSSDWDSDWD